jgi:hypothetical protein
MNRRRPFSASRSSAGDQLCRVGDFTLTAPLRTLIDLMSSRPFVSGVVAADFMLHDIARFGIIRDGSIALVAALSPFRRWEWDDAWRGAPMFAKLHAAGIHPTKLERL